MLARGSTVRSLVAPVPGHWQSKTSAVSGVVQTVSLFRTRRASKTSSDDCRYGTGSPRFACPLRKTPEIVPQGAPAQIQVQVSGTVVPRPHICQLCRTWSSLPVRARFYRPPDTGTPCSTAVVYPTWTLLPQAD